MSDGLGQLELPASAVSDEQQLAACQRILRLLATEFNECGLPVGPRLEGRRADIHERTLLVCGTLIPLRVSVRVANGWKLTTDGMDPRELGAKEAALADTQYDAELSDNPILKPRDQQLDVDDPTEDLNTYDWTTDPNSRFTISGSGDQVTVVGLTKNEDAYGYKNFGAGYFVDFTHLFTASCSTINNLQAGFFCATTTELDDFRNNDDAAGSFWSSNGVAISFHIRHSILGVQQDQDNIVAALSTSTDYYFTYARTGSTVTCDMYDDSARTSQVGVTLTIDDDGTARQYFMPAISFNSGAVVAISCIVKDVDLQQGPRGLGFAAAGAVLTESRLDGDVLVESRLGCTVTHP